MKKCNKNKQLAEIAIKNPVAKYARQFNKAQVFEDKTKYQRGEKHKGREPFSMSLRKGIAKGDLFLCKLFLTNSIMQFFKVHPQPGFIFSLACF